MRLGGYSAALGSGEEEKSKASAAEHGAKIVAKQAVKAKAAKTAKANIGMRPQKSGEGVSIGNHML